MGERFRSLARIWADALTYALAVTAVAAVAALVLSVATGGGLVRTKAFLFVGGWVLLAYATVRLWPTSPEDVGDPQRNRVGESLPETETSTRFQTFVRRLPPMRWIQSPPPEDRMTTQGKLLLGSLLVLLLSFLLETVFGVG
ncbi:hypothetical protein ACFO5R_20425 [Halosolutus amylolyticus]|uniref:DUF3899 domain-containing protein n=2 Tax=Halosolutus amylolyticus TaxID=2932267 RepID=A0ABD5PVE6_9EURY|nr:hypothetical protein [Halosolutus amylolyticus]